MTATQVNELDLEGFDGQLTQVIVLPNIRWSTYQSLLADMGNHRSTRVAYDPNPIRGFRSKTRRCWLASILTFLRIYRRIS